MEWRTLSKPGLFSVFTRRKKPRARDQQAPRPPNSEHDRVTSMQEDCSPRDRVIARYSQTAKILEQTIELSEGSWGRFDFQGLGGEGGDFNDQKFHTNLKLALASKEGAIKDQILWSKCQQTVECTFTALVSHEKNVLPSIAKKHQEVRFLYLPSCYLINAVATRYSCILPNLRWSAFTHHVNSPLIF